jgi:hypothetical protein
VYVVSLHLIVAQRPRRAARIVTASFVALVAATTPPAVPSYQPPVLALVQPATGGSVPQDRPVIVFRFAPGDSIDPVNAQLAITAAAAPDANASPRNRKRTLLHLVLAALKELLAP